MARRAHAASAERLVVMGASMGGVEALKLVFAGVEPDPRLAFVIVVHRSGGSTVMPAILSRACEMPASVTNDGEPILGGRIYVAKPGFHTTVDDDTLSVFVSPRDNNHRPSVDVLFRSAARAYGSRAIGVVLSGALDCGAVGLAAIKARGGLAVVQDPRTAINPQMPESALDEVAADYVVAPEEIGPLLRQLVAQKPPPDKRAPRDGGEQKSSYVCPECNGPIRVDAASFTCRVGHRYSAETFYAQKHTRLEAALWEALNVMQERIELCKRMAARARENGHDQTAQRYTDKANDSAEHAAVLRDVIYSTDGELPIDASTEQQPPAGKAARKRTRRRKER